VVYLEDGWLAVLSPEGCRFEKDGQPVEARPAEIRWSADDAGLGGHPHFMHKEIFEQPAVLARMARERLRLPAEGPPAIDDTGWAFSDASWREVKRVVLVAQGTAFHAAMIARNMLERTAHVPAYAEYAADFRYRDPILDPSVLVLAVTQSGETMDTLGAIRCAREAGCRTVSFVNQAGSAAARESDGMFLLDCGPEIGVASTKAFTAMLSALYLFAIRFGLARGALPEAEARRRALDVQRAATRVEAALTVEPLVRAVAHKYKDAQHFLFLGRGTGWPLAMEGALKLKEVSYIHAEGYDAAEMKHGPIALVDEKMPALFIALGGRRYGKIVGNIQEVRARGGHILALASHDDAEIGKLAEDVIPVQADTGVMNSAVCAVPLQLLAYHIAAARGCDVDKPKNLAKSVTVE
jgi:glucosamine--fructose-6-phosphate aminotransferase (isomerizing)